MIDCPNPCWVGDGYCIIIEHFSACTVSWVGDGYCDDINNNIECNYDGGDCCGDNVNTQYCEVCQCISEGGSTEDPGTTGLTGGTTASPSGTSS